MFVSALSLNAIGNILLSKLHCIANCQRNLKSLVFLGNFATFLLRFYFFPVLLLLLPSFPKEGCNY